MTTETCPAIEARGLTKQFGDVTAVAGVDVEVRPGDLFGFLGPNGAGKTTTINILTGAARPDSGTVRIAGIDCSKNPKAAQHLLGVVPDESNLYPELTGFQNLCFCGALYGLRKRDRETRAHDLLNRFGLAEAANRKFGGYSKGMKRKLTLAASLMHTPPILFLDEPTTGLDVAAARHIRLLIAELNRAGVTIFLTTHYIEEAERLCRRIAFIVKGRIVRSDTIDNLMRSAEGRYSLEFAVKGNAAGLCDRLRTMFPGFRCRPVATGGLRVEDSEPIRIAPLVRFLEDQAVEVMEARRIRPSLEDVFVETTGIETKQME